jgi:hypothetical protein
MFWGSEVLVKKPEKERGRIFLFGTGHWIMRLSGGDCEANAVVHVRISLCVTYDSHQSPHFSLPFGNLPKYMVIGH